ncbi:hypothetical protein SY85_13755 [Flavisolibacter tropicus]|uniref:Carbohydrate-binding protein SusD n=2 Tax=Flavisolibacter tropicus TaxID=1492898 RepID=A0A172TWJ8_9BACT|nr:hypothetical protein SY85_13755 [Flavisolibacter tropicus]
MGIAALSLSSCSKNLDIPPVDQISNDQYWKTGSDLNSYVLQFYTAFPTFRNQSGFHGNIGMDAYNGSDHQIQNIPVTQMNGTRTATASGGRWNWASIRAVNIFFENYQKVNEPAANIAQYVGEAHFFKAWFYFEKVRFFGDVPWYTNSMLANDAHLYDARTPRTQVVDSILYHLDQAIAKLSLLKDVPGGNNRLSKEAALIFKTRVALFEGSWQKYHAGTPFATSGANPSKYFQAAVDAAKELMTPGKYKVGIYNTGKPASDYNALFNSTNLSSNTEVTLWCKFDKSQSTFSHNFQQYITSGTNGLSATRELILNYLKKDGTPYDYDGTAATVKGSAFLTKIGTDCDPRLSQVIWIPGQTMWDNSAGKVLFVKPSLEKSGENKNYTGFQMNKGVDPKDPTAGGALGFSTACETGAVVFRYAEALLNYAEAQAELGGAIDYASSIDKLRARAGMPNFAAQADASRSKYADFGYTLSNELYEIRRERAVELACEGFRFDDWRRWRAHNLFKGKRPTGFPYLASEYAAGLVVPTDASGLVDPFKTSMASGYNFNVGRDYLDNIPTNEITLNPKLTPNPGW